MSGQTRRQVKSRGKRIFHDLASLLIRLGLKPNQVSVLSSIFALLGAGGFYLMSQEQLWIGAFLVLVGIQMRLVCNLIDGLMAVEGKLSSPEGELYNDVPDRISDAVLIFGAGYLLPYQGHLHESLIWVTILAATLTAYVRTLGASMGVGHFFLGPMAKQHRMAVLNVLTLVWLFCELFAFPDLGKSLALIGFWMILVGSFVTCLRRLQNIRHAVRALDSQESD